LNWGSPVPPVAVVYTNWANGEPRARLRSATRGTYRTGHLRGLAPVKQTTMPIVRRSGRLVLGCRLHVNLPDNGRILTCARADGHEVPVTGMWPSCTGSSASVRQTSPCRVQMFVGIPAIYFRKISLSLDFATCSFGALAGRHRAIKDSNRDAQPLFNVHGAKTAPVCTR